MLQVLHEIVLQDSSLDNGFLAGGGSSVRDTRYMIFNIYICGKKHLVTRFVRFSQEGKSIFLTLIYCNYGNLLGILGELSVVYINSALFDRLSRDSDLTLSLLLCLWGRLHFLHNIFLLISCRVLCKCSSYLKYMLGRCSLIWVCDDISTIMV